MYFAIKKINPVEIVLLMILSMVCAVSPMSGILIFVLVIGVIIYFMFLRETLWMFFLLTPFIPMYVGLNISDSFPYISLFRILLFVFFIDQLIIKKRANLFLKIIKNDANNKLHLMLSILFLISGMFNFIIKGSLESIVGSVSFIIENIMFYFIIKTAVYSEKEKIGAKLLEAKFLKSLFIILIFLSTFGIFESMFSYNIFSGMNIFQNTSIATEDYIRLGEIRVKTTFVHSLGYAIFILLLLPIVLESYKNNMINKFLAITLYMLMIYNLFLTLSRSMLIVLLISVIFYFLYWSNKKRIIFFYVNLITIPMLIAFSLMKATENMLISKNVKAIIDSLFGTKLSKNFGDNSEPFEYRLRLIDYMLDQDAINSLLGKGIGFIRNSPLSFNIPEINPYGPVISYSIDNFYINMALENGYIITITFLVLIFKNIRTIYQHSRENVFLKSVFIGIMSYSLALTTVNDLYTFKYVWIILAFSNVLIEKEDIKHE